MEGFGKYIGIQGIVFLLLIFGYIGAIFAKVPLPEGYTELLTLVVGFYFAKNGTNVIRAVRPGG
jgi:hypothetical protein